MSNDRFRADRESVLFHSKRMWEAGLVVASAGNVSARVSGHSAIAITPTSVSYDVMTADQVVVVSLDSGLPIESKVRPSAELPTHLAVYRHRQDVGAVVMEATARIYVESLRTGDPVVLPEESLRAGRAMYEKLRRRPR
jgi:L-ribulose-5-phosphate 4-epimerase